MKRSCGFITSMISKSNSDFASMVAVLWIYPIKVGFSSIFQSGLSRETGWHFSLGLFIFFFNFFFLCHNPLKQYFRKWQRSSICKMSWSQTIRVIAATFIVHQCPLPSAASWNYSSPWSEAGLALRVSCLNNFFAVPCFCSRARAELII